MQRKTLQQNAQKVCFREFLLDTFTCSEDDGILPKFVSDVITYRKGDGSKLMTLEDLYEIGPFDKKTEELVRFFRDAYKKYARSQ